MRKYLWDELFVRREAIKHEYPALVNSCNIILENFWLMKIRFDEILNKYSQDVGEELMPQKQFIIIYFLRNIAYLASADILAEFGLINPARNIIRTVYETLLRGYLFLYYEDEANLMYDYINEKITNEDLKTLQKRKFWPVNYMVDKLYEGDCKKGHRKYYEEISYFAHPSIRDAFDDLYRIMGLENVFRSILGFSFSNIELFELTFPEFIDDELQRIIHDTKRSIGLVIEKGILFKPNK